MEYLVSNYANIEKVKIGHVPTLIITPATKEGEEINTILFYHGWSSCKENQVFRGNILASYGYRVVIPDAWNHGERGKLDYDDDEVMRKYILETIMHNIEEAPMIFRYIEEELQAKKIAVAGHSMGAMTGGGLFSFKKSLAAAFLFNGSSNWSYLVESINQDKKQEEISYEELRINDFMLDNNPMDFVETVADRPLVLFNGADDENVSPEAQEAYYKKAVELYQNKELINFEKFESTAHQLTTQMLEKAIMFAKEKADF